MIAPRVGISTQNPRCWNKADAMGCSSTPKIKPPLSAASLCRFRGIRFALLVADEVSQQTTKMAGIEQATCLLVLLHRLAECLSVLWRTRQQRCKDVHSGFSQSGFRLSQEVRQFHLTWANINESAASDINDCIVWPERIHSK